MARVSLRPAVAAAGSFGGWRGPVPRLQEARFSQSVERGLAILECFTPERPVWGIADLADELGMSRSTTHRYALTLTALGYLVQGERRKYRLGLRVTDLGLSALSSTSLREHARAHLEELCRRTSYTVSIAVLDGAEILYIERVRGSRDGEQQIDLGLAVESRLPAYCTAMGKLLLAYLPAAEQQRAIAEMPLAKRAPNTITNRKALRAELEHVREAGLAINDQELAAGLFSIAVAVRDESGDVCAALDMAAHTSMISLESLVGHLAPHLITTADRISAQLGYRRADELPSPRGLGPSVIGGSRG